MALSSNWEHRPLADCGRWLSGGTPRTSASEYWGGDTPWISAISLKDFNIQTSDRRVTALGIQNGTRVVPRGTIIMVVRGMSLKSEFRMGVTRRVVAFGQDCKAIIPMSDIDPTYLAYAIRASTPEVLAMVDEAGHGTGRLQTDRLEKLQIPVPPPTEQRAIAEMLGALDDKIALNDRLANTSQALALSLFEGEAGQQRGVVHRLDEVADIAKGISYRSEELASSSTALVTLKSVGRGARYQQRGLKGYRGLVKPDQVVEPGEVVVAMTDLTQAADVIGRAVRVRPSRAFTRLAASLDLSIVRPRADGITSEFLLGLLSTQDFHDHNRSYCNGTTVLHLSSRALPNYQVAIPDESTVTRLSNLMRPLLDRADLAEAESENLAALRDVLLPRLLSGELRVGQAEDAVCAAT